MTHLRDSHDPRQKSVGLDLGKMSGLQRIAVDAFKAAVKAVNPYKAVRGSLGVTGSPERFLCCDNDKLRLDGKNVYCCSFGKAGYEMFKAVDEMLPSNLARSILSLPIGQERTISAHWKSQNVEMFFGAANNIADSGSLNAAEHIFEMASNIKKNQILIALISGGGSALLPLPCDGISLKDTQDVTKALFKKAATIQELNTVRKALSKVKGGGLLRAAQEGKVLSLILSDIIGDPISLIASAPTVIDDTEDPSEAFRIIQRYQLTKKLPSNVIHHLKSRKANECKMEPGIVKIVGSNRIALDAAADFTNSKGYDSIVLGDQMCGEARTSGRLLADLIHELRTLKREGNVQILIEELLPNMEKESSRLLTRKIGKMVNRTKPIALLMGGETTVIVRGKGKGGRNQELALSASLRLKELNVKDCIVLAAGTDGIDGPTDAAGAFGHAQAVEDETKAEESLDNNDTYNYHRETGTLFTVGHTGTNVMDMVIAIIN